VRHDSLDYLADGGGRKGDISGPAPSRKEKLFFQKIVLALRNQREKTQHANYQGVFFCWGVGGWETSPFGDDSFCWGGVRTLKIRFELPHNGFAIMKRGLFPNKKALNKRKEPIWEKSRCQNASGDILPGVLKRKKG